MPAVAIKAKSSEHLLNDMVDRWDLWSSLKARHLRNFEGRVDDRSRDCDISDLHLVATAGCYTNQQHHSWMEALDDPSGSSSSGLLAGLADAVNQGLKCCSRWARGEVPAPKDISIDVVAVLPVVDVQSTLHGGKFGADNRNQSDVKGVRAHAPPPNRFVASATGAPPSVVRCRSCCSGH
jgi:hypothetical protein